MNSLGKVTLYGIRTWRHRYCVEHMPSLLCSYLRLIIQNTNARQIVLTPVTLRSWSIIIHSIPRVNIPLLLKVFWWRSMSLKLNRLSQVFVSEANLILTIWHGWSMALMVQISHHIVSARKSLIFNCSVNIKSVVL